MPSLFIQQPLECNSNLDEIRINNSTGTHVIVEIRLESAQLSNLDGQLRGG